MKYLIQHYAKINQLAEHIQIKQELLSLIDNAPYQSSVNHNEDVDITKTDWMYGKDFTRPWVQYFLPYLKRHLLNTIEPFNDFLIQDIWFQQYNNNSQHGWHTHSHNFTGVYYLTTPTAQTQIIQPFTEEQQTLPVLEGDVLMFPSTVIHRAPPASDKTIISFNFDAFYHYTNVL